MGVRLIGLLPRVPVRSERGAVCEAPPRGPAGAITPGNTGLGLSRGTVGSVSLGIRPVGGSCSSALSLGVRLGSQGGVPEHPDSHLTASRMDAASLQCITCATLQCPGFASLTSLMAPSCCPSTSMLTSQSSLALRASPQLLSGKAGGEGPTDQGWKGRAGLA